MDKVSKLSNLHISKEQALEALLEYKAWLKTKPDISKYKYGSFKSKLWKAWPGSSNPAYDGMYNTYYLKRIARGLPVFTEGDWYPGCFVNKDSSCNCTSVLGNYWGSICQVSWSPDRTLENGDNPPFWQAVANAKLISIAPDLYRELERLDPNNPLLKRVLL